MRTKTASALPYAFRTESRSAYLNLHGDKRLSTQDWTGLGVPYLVHFENRGLVGGVRITKTQRHDEPVEVGMGQRERPVTVNLVLSPDDPEGRRDGLTQAVGRDLALVHRLQ